MSRYGRVPGLLDESGQMLYDTLLLAAGTATYRFFTAPIGPAKSRLLTNMQLAGVLPAPQSFVVQAIRVIIKSATTLIVDDCIMRSRLEFRVGEKEHMVCPTCLMTAGAGVWNTITTDFGQNGAPEARSIAVLSKPVVIGVSQAFYVDLIYDVAPVTAKAGVYVLVVLDGYQTRGVQ